MTLYGNLQDPNRKTISLQPNSTRLKSTGISSVDLFIYFSRAEKKPVEKKVCDVKPKSPPTPNPLFLFKAFATAYTIRPTIDHLLQDFTIRAKALPGNARQDHRRGRRLLRPNACEDLPLKELNGAARPLTDRDPFGVPYARWEEGCSAEPSMSCPSGESCSMGERRLTVNRRTQEKSGGPRIEEDITVIDDNPVLVVPVLQEPEPKTTKISLPSVKPKGGGASKRWALISSQSCGGDYSIHYFPTHISYRRCARRAYNDTHCVD